MNNTENPHKKKRNIKIKQKLMKILKPIISKKLTQNPFRDLALGHDFQVLKSIAGSGNLSSL